MTGTNPRASLVSMTTRVRMIVTGRVQGVGFRVSCAREAARLGVGGSVRNLVDGSVEVRAEGDDAAVEAMTTWCHAGPMYAKVRSVDVVAEPPEGATDFRIT